MKEPITLTRKEDGKQVVVKGLSDFIRDVWLPTNHLESSNGAFFNRMIQKHGKSIKYCKRSLFCAGISTLLLFKICKDIDKRVKTLEETYTELAGDLTEELDILNDKLNELLSEKEDEKEE